MPSVTKTIKSWFQVTVSKGLDFAMLNTLYWAKLPRVDYEKGDSKIPWRPEILRIADEQLDWLKTLLSEAQAEGRKVLIVGHVPIG